jgi:hypothetical protein
MINLNPSLGNKFKLWQRQYQKVGCLLASVGLGLTSCGLWLTPKPGARPLAPAEIEQLHRELAQTIADMPERIKMVPIYSDQRTPEQKQDILTFQEAWAKLNPSIAPFLGQRDVTHPYAVYPSRQLGQVCVRYGYDASVGDILTVGMVEADGRIYTENNEILFLEGMYLVMFAVGQDDKPSVSVLPVPYLYDKSLEPGLEQELNALGCTLGMP